MDLKIYGDISLINKENKLYANSIVYGDCLDAMKYIEDKSIDMILCDLPYGVTPAKWDNVVPIDLLWEQYKRIIKDNGAIVLFGIEPFSTYLRMSNIKWYRYDWYWEKNHASGFNYSHKQPMRLYENICVFYKKSPYYDWGGGGYQAHNSCIANS